MAVPRPVLLLPAAERDPCPGFPEGTIHDVSGTASAASSASGTATVIPAAWQPTGTPWPEATLGIEASWRKEAMLHGMTDAAVKLGTVLTQGWFWTRRAGCSAYTSCRIGEACHRAQLPPPSRGAGRCQTDRLAHVPAPRGRLELLLSPPAVQQLRAPGPNDGSGGPAFAWPQTANWSRLHRIPFSA